MSDRIGIGWRPELAAGILAHLDHIDALEVVIEDWTTAPAIDLRALRTIRSQVPMLLHGISLGLASESPVDQARLGEVARLVGDIGPESWSEHLAFVRAGGIEIGHLAAPPRTRATIDGTCANVSTAARVVGMVPQLENIATLIDPPGSELDEMQWIAGAVEAASAPLLLDLHNLYANAVNFGQDPLRQLLRLPLERVTTVHIAGGRWSGRLIDDHLHAVPDRVYALLTELAARASGPLTVLLERDGNFPPMQVLLSELGRARDACAKGRARKRLA